MPLREVAVRITSCGRGLDLSSKDAAIAVESVSMVSGVDRCLGDQFSV